MCAHATEIHAHVYAHMTKFHSYYLLIFEMVLRNAREELKNMRSSHLMYIHYVILGCQYESQRERERE
jgi:hypothetical protein